MGLLEAGLLGETEAGEIAFLDAFPESIAEIILQNSEFHTAEYSMAYSNPLIRKRYPQPFGYIDLDCANEEL